MNQVQKRWSDNALEDYFLELVIKKHVIDREIADIINVIDASPLHDDYRTLIKKVLFWDKNLYLENWWTLEHSLMDMVKTTDIRGHEIEVYGVVLGIMLRVIEEVFDVDNELFHDFILSESKEDIEHRLVILIKRVLDFITAGLKEMFHNTRHLDKPIGDGHIRKEFSVIHDTLLQYSSLILESEGNHIRELKLQIDSLVNKIRQKRRILHVYLDNLLPSKKFLP